LCEVGGGVAMCSGSLVGALGSIDRLLNGCSAESVKLETAVFTSPGQPNIRAWSVRRPQNLERRGALGEEAVGSGGRELDRRAGRSISTGRKSSDDNEALRRSRGRRGPERVSWLWESWDGGAWYIHSEWSIFNKNHEIWIW